MSLKKERLYLDINARTDTRLAQSLDDPTRIDPGPLWIEGEKRVVEIYLVEIRGQEVAPIDIPAGYTCVLNAMRRDGENETEIFSVALERAVAQQNGNIAFTGTLDLTGAEITNTLAIEDSQLTEGVRLRVQALISAGDDSEILRPSFLAILRANLDPAA